MSTAEQSNEDKKVEELIEAADPATQVREQYVGGLPGSIYETFEQTYVQRPLSWLPKLELSKILGKALDEMTAGDDPVSLKQLMESEARYSPAGTVTVVANSREVAGRDTQFTSLSPRQKITVNGFESAVEEIDDDEHLRVVNAFPSSGEDSSWTTVGGWNVDMIARIFVRISQRVPSIVVDLYMLSLHVPAGERPFVEEIWSQYHDYETGRGGLSDDDGADLLTTFVEQNVEPIANLFRERGPRLWERIQTAFSRTPESSKPSKRSARSTRSSR